MMSVYVTLWVMWFLIAMFSNFKSFRVNSFYCNMSSNTNFESSQRNNFSGQTYCTICMFLYPTAALWDTRHILNFTYKTLPVRPKFENINDLKTRHLKAGLSKNFICNIVLFFHYLHFYVN